MADASLFRWQAVDSQGQLVSGQLLAIDSDNLLLMLAQRDLLPVSWKREKVWRQREWKWQHKTDLIRQLATLLKAGLPLAESLALLAEGHPHAGWRALMLVLHHRVLSGAPFSQALREWPQIFPALYPALMEVGELTGQLDTCCSELARQQIRQQQLWHQVAKALRYPLFILLVAIAVTCGMLLFVLLAVCIAGQMIGRTPEYLGKKIDVREMKMTAIAILVTPALVLLGTALALMTEAGRAGIYNPGIHGFSEVLYGVSSAANNNGSAFAGLGANTPFWNSLQAFCMFVGRFGVIVPVIAIAGSLVSKKIQPASTGTLPTTGALFIGLLIGTVVLVGALTFIPALALGPVAEHLSLR